MDELLTPFSFYHSFAGFKCELRTAERDGQQFWQLSLCRHFLQRAVFELGTMAPDFPISFLSLMILDMRHAPGQVLIHGALFNFTLAKPCCEWSRSIFFLLSLEEKLSVSFFCPLHVTLPSSSYKSLYRVFVTWAGGNYFQTPQWFSFFQAGFAAVISCFLVIQQ